MSPHPVSPRPFPTRTTHRSCHGPTPFPLRPRPRRRQRCLQRPAGAGGTGAARARAGGRPRRRRRAARGPPPRHHVGGRASGRPLRLAPDQPHRRPPARRAVGGWRERGQRPDRGHPPDRLRARAVAERRHHRLAQERRGGRGLLLHRVARFVRGPHRPPAERGRHRRGGVPGAPASAAPGAVRGVAGGRSPARRPRAPRRRGRRQRRGRHGRGRACRTRFGILAARQFPWQRRRRLGPGRTGLTHGPARGVAPAPPPAPSARAERLGTGHGEREYAPITRTTFERATSHPAELVQIRYDSHANLVAAGILPPHRHVAPEPFPGYVPDPR